MVNYRRYFVIGVLWCLLIVSAFLVVTTTHQIRFSTKQYNQLKQQYNQLNQQQNHLLLEHDALSGYSRLEYMAQTELGLINLPASAIEKVVYE